MCARPRKMAGHFVGAPRTDFNSSAEVNSACGKVFPMEKRLYAPLGAMRTQRKGVANEQAILPGDAGNTGENIVKIGHGGLARPGVLRDKGVRDLRPEVAGGQAGLLHGSHSIGNDI